MTELPPGITINAWTGTGAASAALRDQPEVWGAKGGLPQPQEPLLVGKPPNPLDWSAADVGYGVLLPDNPQFTPRDRAAGRDAPEPVRRLLAARTGTVMLRWDPALPPGKVRRYFADGSTQSPTIGLSRFGTGEGELPQYVAIIGGPDVIPWSVQYEFGTRHSVGRIPLTGAALANYIGALLTGWADAEVDAGAPLMWTVDLPGDITAEMRVVIADPLAERLTDPTLPGFRHLAAGDATRESLLAVLASARPALVISSSHGAVLSDDTLAATLGLPVDQQHQLVGLDALDAAIPPGTVWFAQACCSAGSEGPSKYTRLLGAGSATTSVEAAASLGSTVAPAALRLLGRPHPVRAVLGHVEPTFDWTLRDAETGQGLAHDIVAAVSTNLYNGHPAGYAFAAYRLGVGQLHIDWARKSDLLNAGDATVLKPMTRLRLTALDRQSLVLLGDPTVTLAGQPGKP
jgi:hypothetical protein